jgi:hypothetical protein
LRIVENPELLEGRIWKFFAPLLLGCFATKIKTRGQVILFGIYRKGAKQNVPKRDAVHFLSGSECGEAQFY